MCFLYLFWLRGRLRKVNLLSHVYCNLEVVNYLLLVLVRLSLFVYVQIVSRLCVQP